MAIRSILAAASGGSANDGTIELACRWAKQLSAHVEGFHAVGDPRVVFAMAGGEFGPASEQLFERLADDAAATAARARAAFAAIAERHGLSLRTPADTVGPEQASNWCCWREATGYAPRLVAQRGRFFDLVVLGRSERVVDSPYTQTIEETLEESGRPVLLAPAGCPARLGHSIAIAWNGSPAAARAVAAALPFLAAAEAVSAIMIGSGTEAESSLAALTRYLGWHGIKPTSCAVPQMHGGSIAESLLAAAAESNADMLVMGGYGRRPWREDVFGGATRDVLRANTPPLLLMH